MSDDTDKNVAGDWAPSAGLGALRERARLLALSREFFAERGVLEVETPAMAHAGASDVHIASLATVSQDGRRFYLQTSPEFAMKRLLAAGSGPIYQVCRAFRDGESGPLHNPEFTLLEWYRPGFDEHALMDELDELLVRLLDTRPSKRRVTYRQACAEFGDFDPFEASTPMLLEHADGRGLRVPQEDVGERDLLLDFLFSHVVQPALEGRVFVYDYPASQAALARVCASQPPVAARFELFVDGIEIANGYHELADAVEQRRRFNADRRARESRGLEQVPMDERLIAALAHGLPDCSGVAVGLDRLFMIATGQTSIESVIAFPTSRA